MYVLIYCKVLQIYVGMINCSHCYNCKSIIVLLGAINEFEFWKQLLMPIINGVFGLMIF